MSFLFKIGYFIRTWVDLTLTKQCKQRLKSELHSSPRHLLAGSQTNFELTDLHEIEAQTSEEFV